MGFIPQHIMLGVLAMFIGKEAHDIGKDIYTELGEANSLKQTIEATMTNIGIVSALLLSVCVASLQADSPTESPLSLLAQWYLGFMWMAAGLAVVSTFISALVVCYMTPLSDAGAKAFARE